ncbi:MAG: ABC transporter permease [Candidatus Hodarchaeota archaeon]
MVLVKEEKKQKIEVKRSSQLRMELRRLKRHKPAMIGLGITLMVLVIAFLAPVIARHHYAEQNLDHMLEGPSWEFPLGTDAVGRCVFSRIVYGSRIALLIGLVVVSIEAGIGITLGLFAGYFGGKLDTFISGITDTVWAFPPLVLALGIVTAIGPGLFNVVASIAIISWAPFTRITRAKVQTVREREFVEAGRAIGESDTSLLLRYILPNIVASNMVLATLTFPSAILTASAMSFLGFGAQPPMPDWGAILSEGREYLRSAPWISTFPGLSILILVLGFNFLGDGVRDAFDPRLKF